MTPYKVYTFSDGSTFRLDGIFDRNFEVNSLRIEEGLLGSIPTIELLYNSDTEIASLGEIISGSLITGNGYSNNFIGYVYECIFGNYSGTLRILCCDFDFTRTPRTNKFNDIDQALTVLYYKGRLDQVSTDLLTFEDPWYLYQKYETNYKLCKKLCQAYKYNSVYGFLLDGLKIVDLDNMEPVGSMTDLGELKLVSPASITNPKLLLELPVTLDYEFNRSELASPTDTNHSLIRFYDTFVPTNSVYNTLISNYLHNSKLNHNKFDSVFESKLLVDYQVGDCLSIVSDQFNLPKAYLSNRIIDVQKQELKVTYTFKSLNL